MQKLVPFPEAIKRMFTRWTLKGRSSRSEFWWCYLLVAAVGMFPIIGAFVSLGLLPALFCVMIRRLHDTGRSAWMALLFLIPIAGFIIGIIFLVGVSKPEENQYGPVPNVE